MGRVAEGEGQGPEAMSTAMAKVAKASAKVKGQVLGAWGGQCHDEGQGFGAMPEPMVMVMAARGRGQK